MDALKKLHISVAQAFENSLDKAYRDLNAQLTSYETRVKDAEERARIADEACREMALAADMLRHEMPYLREEWREKEVDSTDNGPPLESLELDERFEPARVFGEENDSNLSTEQLKTISERYSELYGQAGTFLDALIALRAQVKSHKRKLERLQILFQRRQFTLKLGRQVVRFQRVEKGSPQTTRLLNAGGGAANPSILNRKSVASTLTQRSDTRDKWGSAGEEEPRVGNPRPDPTSDSLADGSPPPLTLASSSPGVGILKRTNSGSHQQTQNTSSSNSAESGGQWCPTRVKSEPISSSPLAIDSPRRGPPGTQDLDDIGHTVATPTKRFRFCRDQNLHSLPEDSTNIAESLSGQRITYQNHTNETEKGSRVLQPLDSNRQNPSDIGQCPNKKRRKDVGSIMRISTIAEDGDENRPPAFAMEQRAKSLEVSPYARQPASERLLIDLLERPSSSSKFLQPKHPTSGSKTSRNRARSPEENSTVICRSESTTMSTATPSSSAPSSGHRELSALPYEAGNGSQTEVTPDDEPYRARPLHRLHLDHFKINPDHNQGLDFAYDEVVRGKNERKCVSGCTRPGCCGATFLAMARFGIPANEAGMAMSDQDVLEEYLGEDNKHSIDSLSSEQRWELLQEAKARVFSDRFGRHRRQHHRPGTPPGFWRTDMPSTQELEGDREEARRVEREKVKQRHREAMRPGGRWIFADE
ncbi:SAE2 C-terminal domain-containing protein [Aspergillus lucknowensis]|uniref:DNA repair protein endonuclease SAE2/CtIP C-terminus-domain-containing protein n=1 Tax=Aspergillus lucknowensis TaxID=176173 RepID=A0ABR4LHK5_9EURO